MKKIKKDFYLKKLDRRGKIVIWEVDGEKVRSNLDEEFTNFGQHFRFSVIPENEFWLDKEATPDERKFFIDHLMVEWSLMKNGVNYNDAIEIADRKERAERLKRELPKGIKDETVRPAIEKIHRRREGKTDDGIDVWIIDGRLVRSVFYLDFTEGGHEFVYNFVPSNEVWIDNDISAKERSFVLLHELFERRLMAKGMDYDRAHERASKAEWAARHNEKKLKAGLKALGWNK